MQLASVTRSTSSTQQQHAHLNPVGQRRHILLAVQRVTQLEGVCQLAPPLVAGPQAEEEVKGAAGVGGAALGGACLGGRILCDCCPEGAGVKASQVCNGLHGNHREHCGGGPAAARGRVIVVRASWQPARLLSRQAGSAHPSTHSKQKLPPAQTQRWRRQTRVETSGAASLPACRRSCPQTG